MNLRFTKLILAGLLLISSGITTSALAADKKEPAPKKTTKPWYLWELNTISGFEYESNIFLVKEKPTNDLKYLLRQDIRFKVPHQEKMYFEADFTSDLAYYIEQGDHTQTLTGNVLLNLQPTEKLSLGIKDLFNYTPSSKIVTTFGDRLLTQGFKENTADVVAKVRLTPKTALGINTQFYKLDVTDLEADDFMDRRTETYGPTLYYDFTDDISANAGYRFANIDFFQKPDKSMLENEGFMGLVKKFPGWFNVNADLDYQRFGMRNEVAAGPRPRTSDWGGALYLDSTFSLYTKVVVGLFYNRVYPSSRNEYVRYHDDGVNFRIRHFLTPVLIGLVDASFERQNFNADDVYTNVPRESLDATVTSASFTLERVLNSWLSLDGSYRFTRRDSEFAQDSFVDNQVRLSLKASY